MDCVSQTWTRIKPRFGNKWVLGTGLSPKKKEKVDAASMEKSV